MRLKKLTAIIMAAFLTVGTVPMQPVSAAAMEGIQEENLLVPEEAEADEEQIEDQQESEVESDQISSDVAETSPEDGQYSDEDILSEDEENAEESALQDDSEEAASETEESVEEDELPADAEASEDIEAAEGLEEVSEEDLLNAGSGMTLNANGGVFSDGKDTHELTYTTAWIDDYVPARDGYAFVGWYSSAYCKEDEYLSNKNSPHALNNAPAAGTTVFAGWTNDFYTVTFDMGDGYYRSSETGYLKKPEMVYKVPKTHNMNTGYGYYYPSSTSYIYNNDEHYSYKGWTLTEGGDTTVSPSSYNLTENVTFYAKYAQDKYILTYYANDEDAYFGISDYDDEGNSITVESETNIEKFSTNNGKEYMSPGDKPYELKNENKKLVFVDWYLDAECKQSPEWYSDYACTTPWTGGTERYLKIDKDIELYAKWSAENSVLTFDPNGGFFADYNTNYKRKAVISYGGKSGETITYKSIYNPKQEDLQQRFTGWYDNKACTGDPIYTAGSSSYYYLSSYTFTGEDVTYYAGWSKDRKVATFDMNGGVLTSYYDCLTGQTINNVEVTSVQYPSNSYNTPERAPSDAYAKWPDGTKVFEGWYSDKEGGQKITSPSSYSMSGDITLYAHWIPVYNVTFDANGGRIGVGPHYNSGEYTFDSYEETVSYKTKNGGSIEGYPDDSYVLWWENGAVSGKKVFNGWYNGDELVQNLYNYVPSGNTTLKAQWIPVYEVTFDANGGRIGVGRRYNNGVYTFDSYIESVTYKTKKGGVVENHPYDDYMLWWDNDAVSDAKVFEGWYKGEEKISDFSSFIPESDTTLKAHWVTSYDVTFDPAPGRVKVNGKEVEGSVTYKTKGDGTLKSYISEYNVVVPSENYYFFGWYDADDETKTVISSLSSYKPGKTTTLKAKFIPILTVTFDANGGTIEESNEEKPSVERKTNKKGLVQSPVSEYYITPPKDNAFIGWYLEGDDTKTLINFSTYVPEKDVKVLALYKKLYSITFNANGGKIKENYSDTDGNPTKVVKTRKDGTVSSAPSSSYVITPGPERAFEGWFTEAEGGIQITDFSEYVFESDTVIYAHYLTVYKVTFDANGGSLQYYDEAAGKYMTEGSCVYYTKTNGRVSRYPSESSLTKNGYYFVGWFVKGTNTRITSVYSHVFTQDTVLEAHWNKICKVTFDAKGGTFHYTKDDQKIKSGKETFTMTENGRLENYPEDEPVLAGKSFIGWYEQKNGFRVNSLWDYQPTEDTTLVARYNTQYSITFNGNGGTFTYLDDTTGQNETKESAVLKTYGQYNYVKNWPSDAVSKDSTKIFDGWYLSDTKVTRYYEFEKNVTVKAKYLDSYKVTFDLNGGYYNNGDQKIKDPVVVRAAKGKTLSTAAGIVTPQNEDAAVTFDGWYLSSTTFDHSTRINLGSFVPTKDTVVYAHWIKTQKVTFDAATLDSTQGTIVGTGSKTKVFTVISGEKFRYANNGKIPEVVYGGSRQFFLEGWYDAADSTKTVLTDEEILGRVVDKDITYVAVPVSGRTLKFYSNGGTFLSVKEDTSGCGYYSVKIADAELTKASGKEPVVVRKDNPQEPDKHWVFAGWFYDETCTQPANLYDLNKEGHDAINLYAGWSDCYTVTFHTNKEGATFSNGKDTLVVKVVKGEPYRYSEDYSDYATLGGDPDLYDKPDDSYNARGWYTDAKCTEGYRYSVGGYDGIYGFIPTEDTHFYIKWFDYNDAVNVTFDANGGVFSTYNGWWYGYGEPTLSADHKQWTVAVPKGITWDQLDDITNWPYSYDSKPEGKSGASWKYHDKDCKNYVSDDEVIDKDITVYCRWYASSSGSSEDSYEHLTYHACEGYFGDEGTRVKTKAGSYKLYDPKKNNGWYEITLPEHDDDGKVFAGWYTDPERTKPYPDGHYRYQYRYGEYVFWIRFPNKVSDLYAKYDNALQVVFDANGGYFDDDYNRHKDPDTAMRNRNTIKQKVYSGQAVVISDYTKMVRRDGDLLFGGWFTDKACTDEAKIYSYDNDAELFKPTENTILYAKWIEYEKPAKVEIQGAKEHRINIGSSVKLEATVTPAAGATVTGDVHWFIDSFYYKSNDGQYTYCASVDNFGNVTGLAEGYCTVYAEVNGIKSETVKITVSDTVVDADMSLDNTAITLYSGAGKTINAYITPEGNADAMASSIVWESDKTEVATVAKSGNGASAVITGVSEGTATITATLGKIKKTCTVNVITPVALDKESVVISAIKGASTTVKTTYVTVLGSSLAFTVTGTAGEAYDGVVAEKKGAAVSNDGKSEQEWTITVTKDLNLDIPGEALITARVTAGEMTYKDEATLTLNPQQAAGPVRASIGTLYVDAERTNATAVDKGTKVLLYSDTEDSDIWYTTDGSKPEKNGAASALFTNAIVISKDTSVQAIAVKEGRSTSPVYRFDYTIQDWGDAEAYKAAFEKPENIPDGVWYAIGGMVYKEVGNGATTLTKPYTGNKITFNNEIEVFCGTSRLWENRDYTVTFANNINAAGLDAMKGTKSIAPSFTIKGKSNYSNTAVFRFTIEPENINNAQITSEAIVTVAAGPKVSLSKTIPVVSYGGKKLKANKDYALKYYEGTDTTKDPVDPSTVLLTTPDQTYTIKVSGVAGSNFDAATTMDAEVKVVVIDGKDKSIVLASKLKTGDLANKAITVPYREDKAYTKAELFDNSGENVPFGYVYVKSAKTDALTYGVDYSVELTDTDNKSAGTHGFVITGISEKCIGTKTGTYTITEAPDKKWKSVKIAGLNTAVEFTGAAITLKDLYNDGDKNLNPEWKADKEPVLYIGTTKLVKDTDYTVTMTNSGAVGKFDLVFTGINGLSGSTKKTITVKAYNLNDVKKASEAKITVTTQSASFTKAGAKPAVTVKFGNKTLKEGVDYTLTYKNNTKVVPDYNALKAGARPVVMVKGKGNFTGSNATAYFNIYQADVTEAVTLSVSDVTENPKGKSGYFLVTPKLVDGGKAVTAGKNKDVDAISKTDYAYYYAEDTTLTDGTKKYAGDVLSASDKISTGTLIRVTVKVSIKSADKAVRTKNSTYYASGADQSTVLEGYYRFIGTGMDISKMTVAIKKGVTYSFHNGDEIIPVKTEDIQVSYKVKGSNPVYLDSNDFEIVSVSKNRFLGTATVLIRGKAPYGGTKSVTFKIVAHSVK